MLPKKIDLATDTSEDSRAAPDTDNPELIFINPPSEQSLDTMVLPKHERDEPPWIRSDTEETPPDTVNDLTDKSAPSCVEFEITRTSTPRIEPTTEHPEPITVEARTDNPPLTVESSMIDILEPPRTVLWTDKLPQVTVFARIDTSPDRVPEVRTDIVESKHIGPITDSCAESLVKARTDTALPKTAGFTIEQPPLAMRLEAELKHIPALMVPVELRELPLTVNDRIDIPCPPIMLLQNDTEDPKVDEAFTLVLAPTFKSPEELSVP